MTLNGYSAATQTGIPPLPGKSTRRLILWTRTCDPCGKLKFDVRLRPKPIFRPLLDGCAKPSTVEPMEPFPCTRTLIEDKGDRGSAMSFFAKLLKPLRDQMKASGDTLPEDRRQMVAKAQRAWEATLKKGRPNQNQSAK